jgi:hypothetical protein
VSSGTTTQDGSALATAAEAMAVGAALALTLAPGLALAPAEPPADADAVPPPGVHAARNAAVPLARHQREDFPRRLRMRPIGRSSSSSSSELGGVVGAGRVIGFSLAGRPSQRP